MNRKSKINEKGSIAIRLKNVSKKYIIHHQKPTLVEKIINGKDEEFWALKNVNMEINKGEKVGIIGPNGSGKTTLLKIIAGITSQTSGKIITDGKIVSLIDLEAGFHPDLIGEQNIYLNGMVLGMSKLEIKDKISQIIDFADIGQFIDVPMFTYSEGMKLRLGFSVAVHADPDILILDESMNAWDIDFQKKAQKKIEEFFKMGKTILIVTHWLDFVRKNCNKVITLEKGRISKLEISGK